MKPLTDRFWSQVDKTGPCWLWNGARLGGGYGKFAVQINYVRRHLLAHRVAWEETNGPVPCGLWVLHRCDVRNCVNPDHLFLGTAADNSADMVTKGRSARGERNNHAILTAETALEVLDWAKDGIPYAVIGRHFGISVPTVCQVFQGRSWRHVVAEASRCAP